MEGVEVEVEMEVETEVERAEVWGVVAYGMNSPRRFGRGKQYT